jgi:glycerophosphoryl diester phosphodiesterase
MHDDKLVRTTNAVGRIRDLNLNEVAKIDAGRKFSEEFVGEKIPTLYKVLESLGEEILINVELTNYASAWDDLPNRVIKLIEDSGLESRVLIASFNPIALVKCRRISKEIPTALLIHAKSPRLYQSLLHSLLSYDLFHPQESLINSKLVSDELRRGRKVTAWTINDENRMRQLLTFGIAGIITDVPDVAIRIRDEYMAAFDKSASESER